MHVHYFMYASYMDAILCTLFIWTLFYIRCVYRRCFMDAAYICIYILCMLHIVNWDMANLSSQKLFLGSLYIYVLLETAVNV